MTIARYQREHLPTGTWVLNTEVGELGAIAAVGRTGRSGVNVYTYMVRLRSGELEEWCASDIESMVEIDRAMAQAAE